MGYDGQYFRKTVQKEHKRRGGVSRSSQFDNGGSLQAYMKILLLPKLPLTDRFFGAVSIFPSEDARSKGIVYWNTLFQGRKVIIPVSSMGGNRITLDTPYFLEPTKEGHRVCEANLGRQNREKLEQLLLVTKGMLKKTDTTPKTLTPQLKGVLRKTFPTDITETVETYFSAVGYETHQLGLLVDQKH